MIALLVCIVATAAAFPYPEGLGKTEGEIRTVNSTHSRNSGFTINNIGGHDGATEDGKNLTSNESVERSPKGLIGISGGIGRDPKEELPSRDETTGGTRVVEGINRLGEVLAAGVGAGVGTSIGVVRGVSTSVTNIIGGSITEAVEFGHSITKGFSHGLAGGSNIPVEGGHVRKQAGTQTEGSTSEGVGISEGISINDVKTNKPMVVATEIESSSNGGALTEAGDVTGGNKDGTRDSNPAGSTDEYEHGIAGPSATNIARPVGNTGHRYGIATSGANRNGVPQTATMVGLVGYIDGDKTQIMNSPFVGTSADVLKHTGHRYAIIDLGPNGQVPSAPSASIEDVGGNKTGKEGSTAESQTVPQVGASAEVLKSDGHRYGILDSGANRRAVAYTPTTTAAEGSKQQTGIIDSKVESQAVSLVGASDDVMKSESHKNEIGDSGASRHAVPQSSAVAENGLASSVTEASNPTSSRGSSVGNKDSAVGRDLKTSIVAASLQGGGSARGGSHVVE